MRFAFFALVGLIGCLTSPAFLVAENPSPSPTPSLDQRVSDLEREIQEIKSIPAIALALHLRTLSAAATPTASPQTNAPLELVSWEYKFKAGEHDYENRHLFTYILKNLSDKPIKLVHGSILFTDLLGGRLMQIRLIPDVYYSPKETASNSGAWNVNTFESGEGRLPGLSHDDIKAALFIERVVFGDNSTWSDTQQ
jgi:hypothetical protein